MIRRLPDPARAAATVVVGPTRAGGPDRAAVILKMAFDVAPGGAATPSTDPARFALQTQDKQTADGKRLLAEADIAIAKARTDIVVEGFVPAGPAFGTLRINGALWMRRTDDTPLLPDVDANLFGWMHRTEPGRVLGDDPTTDDVTPDPALGYMAFASFHRRGPGFSVPGLTQPLPPGGVVTVTQGQAEDGASFTLRLPATRYHARVRAWCGDCPDTPARWCLAETVPLQADTLILRPSAAQAAILWRGGWDWARHPAARYRAVDIDPIEET